MELPNEAPTAVCPRLCNLVLTLHREALHAYRPRKIGALEINTGDDKSAVRVLPAVVAVEVSSGGTALCIFDSRGVKTSGAIVPRHLMVFPSDEIPRLTILGNDPSAMTPK